jgi:hypothetical protein
MSDRPTSQEAAQALREVDRRHEQALRGSAGQSRWVGVLFGVAVFALLAAPDFFGRTVTSWTSWAFTAVVAAYAVLLRTRRGAAVLGRPNRLRTREISPRFALGARLTILAVFLIGVAGAFVPHPHLSFPYGRTIVGAVLGAALIVFGERWERGLRSLAAGRGGSGGRPTRDPS